MQLPDSPRKGFLVQKTARGEDGLGAVLSSSVAVQCNWRERLSLCKPGFESMQELRCSSLVLARLALESY